MIKSTGKEYILKCVPNNPIKCKILDGYSNFGDGHLILRFKNDENKIEMEQIQPNKTDEKKNIYNIKGLSIGGIIAIVISSFIALLAVYILSISC